MTAQHGKWFRGNLFPITTLSQNPSWVENTGNQLDMMGNIKDVSLNKSLYQINKYVNNTISPTDRLLLHHEQARTL